MRERPLTDEQFERAATQDLLAGRLLGGDLEEGPDGGMAWPVLDASACYGLAGDIVRMIEPHSEADPVAVLVHVLVGFGNLVGRGPHFAVGGARHHANLNAVCVGATASRKGTAWLDSLQVLRGADPQWADSRVQSGLSSGEGLIWAVRDPIEEQQPVRERGRVVEYQTMVVDPGVEDKRLLVIEEELSSLLRVMQRDGNTISAQLRHAWDTGDLRILTKSRAARATGAHISVIGHITQEELLRYLRATEQANGFANRFLWLLVRRSKFLPDGGHLPPAELAELRRRLAGAFQAARAVGEMKRDHEAADLWRAEYPKLAGDRFGLFGAVTSRAEAQTLRLSMVYALLDGSTLIRAEHLRAALALWRYAEQSARLIFGEASGDPLADEIFVALRRAGTTGLTRTEISALFSRNRDAGQIQRALAALSRLGRARVERSRGGAGRPEERWFAMGVAGTKNTNLTN